MPDDPSDMQDALSTSKEECPPSEELIISTGFSIGKTEVEEEEENAMSEVNKECSSSEDFLKHSTSNIEKTEDEEDDEAVRENNLEELKHEVESTSSGSDLESTIPIHMEDNKSIDDSGRLVTNICLAPERGSKNQCTVKQETAYWNEIGTRQLGQRDNISKTTFTQLQELEAQKHVNRPEFLHWCSLCHKSFATGSSLKRHFRVHTGERPFICNICNKAFKQSCHLKQHYQLHDERQFICGVCKKTFYRGFHLEEHLKLHSGKLPYIPEVRGKRFKTIS